MESPTQTPTAAALGPRAQQLQQSARACSGRKMATQDATKGGLHQRAGAREPGLTGGVAEAAFGRSITLLAPTEEAVKQVVGEAAHGKMQSAAHEAWKVAMAGDARMLSPQMDFLLRLLSTGPCAACMMLLTLQNAARKNKLTHPLYARLNLALAASAGALLSLLWFQRHLLTWAAFTATAALLLATVAVVLPPFMQAGPGAILGALPQDMRTPRNRRSALYAVMAVLFFVEGLGIVLSPAMAVKALHGTSGSPVSHLLIQAVALSTHVLVPVVCLCLKMLADTGRLTTTASLLLNLALAGVGLQHVVLLSRAIAAGMAGPVAPVLLAAWSTALATAVYNMPLSVQGSE
ncbi:hypothetical protein WJX81_002036 [Elliptochloris bilobata]|uniref:Uncharacterized protein n=1 Tax=Elliptochloris bilobata TaxID=381761 RepID=A0AAW1RY92_9CHLO